LPPDGEDDESTPFFAELIPVQPGAARIAVFDDTDAEIGSLALEGAQPTVNITNAGTSGDTVDVAWSVQDPDSTEHTYWVDYSPDAGQTWQNQGMGLTETSLAIAADSLAGSDSALFRIIASDGVNSAEAVSAPFTVAKKLPEGEVVEPSGGAYRLRDLVWLQAAAFDPDDGFLDDDSVRWSSSRDGNLGSGASLPVYDLSLGEHTITMTARDSDDNTVTDTVQVTIFDGPIVEGGQQVLWGDLDCDGGLTTRDNQALLRRILQQNPLSQTEPCPALGAVVDVSGTGDRAWGDLDCDGDITTRDNQALQRRVLQQAALSQTQPCPALGSTVGVRE
jgi:hypothetical protein